MSLIMNSLAEMTPSRADTTFSVADMMHGAVDTNIIYLYAAL